MDTHTLYKSDHVQGMLALDSEDGEILDYDRQIVLCLPRGMYLSGRVQCEVSREGSPFIFVPEGGDIMRYGIVLRAGMQIIVL
jgi:hypothetical protein